LQKRWFTRYEISNFAKKWYECKHNMVYWNHTEISWFWLWASYFLWGIRYTNSDQFSNYYKRDHIYSEKLSEQDLFLEKIMFELRTTWITKQNYLQLNNEKIEELIENWLIKKEDDHLKLSDKWIVFLDYILREV
jgi:oxygen-independent coproporphyrinogen-3 oxidase